METGDLEQQPEPLNTVTTSTDAGLANAAPATCASTAGEPATVASESTKITSKPVTTEPAVISTALVEKESLWQRLRKQPRETAAVVVLVVTAIIWLDSGDSNSQKTSKSLDPMDGFESYLSDFETEESSTPLRESADPVENQSPASFGGDLMIPQTQQSEFASTVTANYGDSVFEPANSSSNNIATSTTSTASTTAATAAQYPAAQYPADADAFGSPVHRANSGTAATDMNNSGSQQTRKVRFAGRIKPAN